MKKLKKVMSILLAATIMLLGVTMAFAAVDDTKFSDVAANTWYAESVQYVVNNQLMSGTDTTRFSPDASTSRAMLAAILYRAAGSPGVSDTAGFTDVAADAYYADAVAWASSNNIISGYGNGLFGSDDPVSREQLAAILWRYAGSPAVSGGQSFSDESSMSAYATNAVNWVSANGMMSGTDGNRFAPQDNATRAQVAVILHHYMMLEQSDTQEPVTNTNNDTGTDTEDNNVLVVYYSASGNTKAVAETIANTLNADLFAINPIEPYTEDDLDWTDSSSRVSREHDDPSQRVVEITSTEVENWDSYDTVFIGYPIWWGIAAWPVDGFITANDFTGKTVVPFCTSSSSGIGESGEILAKLAGNGNWQSGQRFRSGASENDIEAWINSMNLNISASSNSSTNQEAR